MDFDLKLKVEFSLDSLAIAASAIYFWEMPVVKKKIANYFSSHSYSYGTFVDIRTSEKWHDIHTLVCHNITSFKLPGKIISELCPMADLIEEKIVCWYLYVINSLGLPSKFADKIFWTAQAQIDENEIFKRFWQNEPYFHRSENNINGLGSRLFMIACMFAQKDFVNKHKKEMSDLINLQLGVANQNYDVSFIINFWLKFYFEPDDTFILSHNTINSLYGKCFNTNLNEAAMFLSDKEEKSEDFFIAKQCLKSLAICKNRYKKEKFMDAVIFLLNKMSQNHKNKFLSKHSVKLLGALLQVWPYRSHFSQIFILAAEQSVRSIDRVSLQRAVIKTEMKVETESVASLQLYKNICNHTFIKILEKIPRNLKRQLFLETYTPSFGKYTLSSHFLESCNYLALNFIFNDPDLLDLKFQILCQEVDRFQRYIRKRQFYKMDEIMKKLMLTEEEIKIVKMENTPFKRSVSLILWVEGGDIDKTDEILDWLSYSEIDKNGLKKKTMPFLCDICLNVVNRMVESTESTHKTLDFEKINKYLEWQFDTEEERIDYKLKLNIDFIYFTLFNKECHSETSDFHLTDDLLRWQYNSDENKIKEKKKEIGTDEFISEKICEQWCRNFFSQGEESAEKVCSKILTWFYGPHEEIFHRPKMLFTKYFLKGFCDRIQKVGKSKKVLAIDKFLEFCHLSDGMKLEVKRTIFNYYIREDI